MNRIAPAIHAELEALPLKIVTLRGRFSGLGQPAGIPCLSADQPNDRLVILVKPSEAPLVILAALTAEELALSPAEADRHCARRVGEKLAQHDLIVVRSSPALPAQTPLRTTHRAMALPATFFTNNVPNRTWTAEYVTSPSDFVLFGGTIIDFRDSENPVRWHRPYTLAHLAKLNHAPVVPCPIPDVPVDCYGVPVIKQNPLAEIVRDCPLVIHEAKSESPAPTEDHRLQPPVA